MADEAKLTVNSFAIFKGYSTELEEGQTPTLTKGDAVKIVKDEGEDGLVVVKVDPDTGEELTQTTDQGEAKIVDRCFPEELTAAEMEKTEATAEAAPAKRTKAKAETTTTTEAKTEAKATGKGKGKTTAKKEAAPAKAETTDTPPASSTFIDVPSVKTLLESTDALAAAEALINQAEATDFTLGGVLHHIHETGVYKQLGFDGKRGFAEYVEKKLGIQDRKARYLMQTYVTFASLGVDTDKLEGIGWSKAKELARIPVEQLRKDYDKLVTLAGEKTRDELTAHITKKYTVATRGQSIKTTAFSFRYAEENGEVITQALARAKPMAGENADDNAALLYIANDFLTGGQGSDMTLAQMVELIESEFGVGVTLTNSSGEEVDAASYIPTAEDTNEVGAEAEQELVPA